MTLVRRVLFVAWQDPVNRGIFPVARLLDRQQDPRWEFVYIRGALLAAERGFQHFLGLEELDAVHESNELPPLFENRVMRSSRPDFPEYIKHLGLPEDTRDEIPILARSEGRRATDTIEVYGLPTFDEVRRVYRFMFFARGVRHLAEAEARIAALRPGAALALEPDPANRADQLAIQVREGAGVQVGFVPNTLLEDLHDLRKLGSKIEVFAERVNPDPAPVQLRLLCRLEAGAVRGYSPFATTRYEPIPAGATRIQIQPQTLVG